MNPSLLDPKAARPQDAPLLEGVLSPEEGLRMVWREREGGLKAEWTVGTFRTPPAVLWNRPAVGGA